MDFKSPDVIGYETGGEPMERRFDWKNERVRMEDRILEALMQLNREMGELKWAVETMKGSWDRANVQERLLTLEAAVQKQSELCAKVQTAKAESDKERAKEEKEEKKRPTTAAWTIGTAVIINAIMYLFTKYVLKD